MTSEAEYWTDDDASEIVEIASSCSIGDLPTELLSEIFSHLSTQDKLVVSRVCQTFQTVIFDSRLFSTEMNLLNLQGGEEGLTVDLSQVKPFHLEYLFTRMDSRISGLALNLIKLDGMAMTRSLLDTLLVTCPNITTLGLSGCFTLIFKDLQDLTFIVSNFPGKLGLVGTSLQMHHPTQFLLSLSNQILRHIFPNGEKLYVDACYRCDTALTSYPTCEMTSLNACPACNRIFQTCPGAGLLKKHNHFIYDEARSILSETTDQSVRDILEMEIIRLNFLNQSMFESPHCTLRCSGCGRRGSPCFDCDALNDVVDYGAWCRNSLCANWTCYKSCRKTAQDYCEDCACINAAYGVSDPLEILAMDPDFGMA